MAEAFFVKKNSCKLEDFRLAVGEYNKSRIVLFEMNENEKFRIIANFPLQGVASLATIWARDKLFLIGGSYHNSKTRSFNSESRIWLLKDGTFSTFQNIPTTGVHDVEAGEVNGNPLLFFSSDKDGRTHKQFSLMCTFNGDSWMEISSIPTSGAHAAEIFSCGNSAYLATANFGSREEKLYKDMSTIHSIDPNGLLSDEPFQELETFGATDFEAFEIDGRCFLAVANEQNRELGSEVKSFLYEFT